MYLFQKRLLGLEDEFLEVRQRIKELRDTILEDSDFDKIQVKLQLDIATGLVRLIKEQAAYYLKLGQSYDAMKLLDDFILELRLEDKALAEKILNIIEEKWNEVESGEDESSETS